VEIESTPLEITRTILDTTSTDEDKKTLVVAVGVNIFKMYYIKHERPCLTTFQNNEKRVEETTRVKETTRSAVFLVNFEVVGNVVKCLIYLLNRN